MTDKHPKKIDTSHLQNPDVSHEESDVPLKPIVRFAVFLTVAAALVFLLMYLLFQYFENREQKESAPRSPLAAERPVLPPEPRLQLAPTTEGQSQPDLKNHPLEELKIMRAEEETATKEYGWVDEKSGVVRLPIERAKQLLLEKGGLPTSPQPAQAAVTPDELFPSDSSGGTKYELRSK